jgi:hypothetical protein
MYFSDLLDERKTARYDSIFEAYRSYADSALFVSGVFPSSIGRKRSQGQAVMREPRAPMIDTDYYVSTGKTMYRMAAQHRLAAATQRVLLSKLAEYFEVYVDALNEMSARYITGPDTVVVAGKMLDQFNHYRASGNARSLEEARRYASLLRVDRERFPALFEGAQPD